MKVIQFQTSHKIILAMLLAMLVGLISIAGAQGSTNRPFTLTEIDAFPDSDTNGKWQYRAVAKNAPGGFSHWRDAPWHWRHYDQTNAIEENINCDDTLSLFPADPASPDTAVSADGGTVTVNIYQRIDTVWVCFAFECDNGTYAYVKMKNAQTERTVTSGPCGQGAPGTGTPDDSGNNQPPADEPEEEEEETVSNPLVTNPDPVNNGGNSQRDDDSNSPSQTQTDDSQNQPQQQTETQTETEEEDDGDSDDDEDEDDSDQDDQEPETVIETPTIRTKQYQGDWK